MEPARSRVREGDSGRDRVVGERRLAAEVTLLEADDATAAQVDRGKDLECACQSHVTVLAF